MYRMEQPQQQVLLRRPGATLRQQVHTANSIARPTRQVQVIAPAPKNTPNMSPWCTPTVSPSPSPIPSPRPSPIQQQHQTHACTFAPGETVSSTVRCCLTIPTYESMKSRAPFEVCDLQIGSLAFDPRQPLLQAKLIACLGADPASNIEAKKGFSGGLNEGVWFLQGGCEEIVLKLVKFDPLAPVQLVEEKQFTKLFKELPNIVEDTALAFPFKVLRLLGPGNVRRYDLIAMKKAAGKSLDEIIHQKFRKGLQADLMNIFEKVGEELATFHQRYDGRQHCDAGTQNIFYDEESDHVTLIDLGGMGNKTSKNDVERLCHVIRRLSQCPAYGPELEGGVHHFNAGYARIAKRMAAAGGA
eukprot:TRINITY_DN1517_c0_g2_i1.p1 TRINITY_DN1517_c0_g2~~TRINITY_DN1517_c0_g2_i1.p1  ORF type:complete len:357 (+),score=80.25 TRINITY_DN1517_c0_g2_i1:66-1136(+)